jgi:predicted alpha/beta hydrolase family esterase
MSLWADRLLQGPTATYVFWAHPHAKCFVPRLARSRYPLADRSLHAAIREKLMLAQLGSEFQILILPGLHDSGPDHWQSHWQRSTPNAVRVEQRDWAHPDLPAWSAQVDAVRQRHTRPTVLVAHSFGCLASVHSLARDADNMVAALLVAPADPDKFEVAHLLPEEPLPCPSLLISSTNDPWMTSSKAQLWGRRWGSLLVDGGALGHINAETGLGTWQFGQDHLARLVALARRESAPPPQQFVRTG